MLKNVPVVGKRRSSSGSHGSHVRRTVSLDNDADDASASSASVGESSYTNSNSNVIVPSTTATISTSTTVAINPIRQLQLDTLQLCGLTHDRAFAIDDSRIGIDVGEYTITKLMEVFFTMVYNDTEDWFR